MSDIKMCDNCGNIFSVNEDGWDEYTRRTTVKHRDSSLPVTTGMKTLHTCAECATGQTGILKPRLAIEKK